MTKVIELRNEILKALKEKYDMTSVEINGNYFAAADIAIKDKQGNLEVFRMSITNCEQF